MRKLASVAEPNTQIRVAGLDVGYSSRRPTAGIGVFTESGIHLHHCFGMEACERLAKTGPYDVVAIDGPVLPEGVDNTVKRNVERAFSKGPFQKRCKPGASHVSGTGIRLREKAGRVANLLSEWTNKSRVTDSFPRVRQGAIVEAFPNAFLGVCLDEEIYRTMPQLKRGRKFEWLYCQWKQRKLVRGLPGLHSKERALLEVKFNQTEHHEHQAALVCIMTALLVAHKQFTAVGDAEGGWFFLPPWTSWARWAQQSVISAIRDLNQNGAKVRIVRGGASS